MTYIGSRMKALEDEYDQRVPPYSSFIVRLDGKNFSKLTKGLKQPFDEQFVRAMVRTMNDLVKNFNASTGYCHSDEISMVFPAVCTKEEFEDNNNEKKHYYDGRVLKICTVMSGYCSVRFNYHLRELIGLNEKDYSKSFVGKIQESGYGFDARALRIEDPGDIVNHMIWRSVFDCYRNAVSSYARHWLGHKKTMNKNRNDMIKMMAEDGLDWNTDVPLHLKHGVYGKKELYFKTVEIDGEQVDAVRQRVKNRAFKIEYSDDNIKNMLAKYWTDTVGIESEIELEL